MLNLFVMIVVIAAIGYALLHLYRNRKSEIDRRTDAAMERDWIQTPYGITIFREADVAYPTQPILDAIDNAFRKVFKKADSKWRPKALATEAEDYTVVILKGVLYHHLPVFKIPVRGGYVGDDNYDKGGFMYVAGVAVDPENCIIALPEASEDMAGAMGLAAMYEAEHCIAYHNDRELYEQTKEHVGSDQGHPIF